jgi:hypothetical protein
MAYQTIKTTTRPNINVPFFLYNEQIINYIKNTYVATGKRISNTVTLSEDGLTQTVTSTWATGTFKEFRSDPQILMNIEAVDAHDLKHGITTTWDKAEI